MNLFFVVWCEHHILCSLNSILGCIILKTVNFSKKRFVFMAFSILLLSVGMSCCNGGVAHLVIYWTLSPRCENYLLCGGMSEVSM